MRCATMNPPPHAEWNPMKERAHDTWSLLGSNLWLRPLEPGDPPRVKAFLARRDLARSRSGDATGLARFLPGDGDLFSAARDQPGLVLLATDAMGAPAGLLVIHTGFADGPAELSFAVPAAGVLPEALRLLEDGLAAHTQLVSVTLRVEPRTFDAILAAAGWLETEPGIWSFRLKKTPAFREAHRAR